MTTFEKDMEYLTTMVKHRRLDGCTIKLFNYVMLFCSLHLELEHFAALCDIGWSNIINYLTAIKTVGFNDEF